VDLPRFLPWLLAGSFLLIIWLIPNTELQVVLDRANWFSPIAYTLAGLFASLLFYRFYAYFVNRFEVLINQWIMRPSITALRFIRNDDAERLLAELDAQTANNFSIGELTRHTIATGIVLPQRNEQELIIMLKRAETRPQAIQALKERGGEQGFDALKTLLAASDLDEKTYAETLKALVSLAKTQPTHSTRRIELEQRLRSILEDPNNAQKQREDAYYGLRELGVGNISKPQPGMKEQIRRNVWKYAIGSLLLIMSIIMLLAMIGQ
jgi:hypothetical protein